MEFENSHEVYSSKKQSQHLFFEHHREFIALIERVEAILSGKINKALNGDEMRKGVMLLDAISGDLQWIGAQLGETKLEREARAEELLHKWAEQNGQEAEFEDIYAALRKIYSLDEQIAAQGIISLDTSIFQTPKTLSKIIPSGNGNTINRIESAEKYAVFCSAFQSLGILSLQDCMIYEEALEWEERMRELPYKIIYTPEPIMQTWCISDEIGQAIYVYSGHPLLDTIVQEMKWGNGVHASLSLEWRKETSAMEWDITRILQNGIGEITPMEWIPVEDMKVRLWAQKALMEAGGFLDSIWMIYLGEGKWDLKKIKGRDQWKGEIGGKSLRSFPSTGWNKKHGTENKNGAILNSTEIAKMLVSVGYKQGDILYIEQKADPFEWKDGMDEEAYKRKAREELETKMNREFLDSIGMTYLGEGKWDLRKMRSSSQWNGKVGGKRLWSFPIGGWNKKHGTGYENGLIRNSEEIAKMLVSVGYKKKDILYIEQKEDTFEWKDGMDEEAYKRKAREELETKMNREFLDSIGMEYLREGEWDLQKMRNNSEWRGRIGGKSLKSFPSTRWNKKHGIGNIKGNIQSSREIVKMLVSVGYKKKDILYIEQKEDTFEWKDGMDEEAYKRKAREELETKMNREFLDSIGMEYLREGEWDLRKLKGNNLWQGKIGGKGLTNFPNAAWNKKYGIGSKNGTILNSTEIVRMLVSVGYEKKDILYIEQKEDPFEWKDGMDDEEYKQKVREELESETNKEFLDSIGIIYLGEGKWDLRKMKGNKLWAGEIGGKRLGSFPSGAWNKEYGIGDKNGTILNSKEIVKMLVYVGYEKEDILYIDQKEDPLGWKDGMEEDTYKRKAREELETKMNREFLDSIGMTYLGEGKWDLRKMKGSGLWKEEIGGKRLNSFPSTTWNKNHGTGNIKGAILNSTEIAKMLVSVGYKEENIQTKK